MDGQYTYRCRWYILSTHHDARLAHSTTADTHQPIEQLTMTLRDDVDIGGQWRV